MASLQSPECVRKRLLVPHHPLSPALVRALRGWWAPARLGKQASPASPVPKALLFHELYGKQWRASLSEEEEKRLQVLGMPWVEI